MRRRNKRSAAFVLGTRPEIIKLSPVIRLFRRKKRPFILIHTGQHYSYHMDAQFFKDLGLPKPHYRFTRPDSIGPNKHSRLVRWMEDSIVKVLRKEKPSAVLVQGDTDTVLAGARASVRAGVPVAHVEAGLRSYDRAMPEERNRVEADRLSHLLLAPTESARGNLLAERLEKGRRIEVTGNTIVDALIQNLRLARKKGARRPGRYALVTLHRPETVDRKKRLLGALSALEELVSDGTLERVVFSLHPRTKKRLLEHGLSPDDLGGRGFEVIDPPMGFLDFIRCEKGASLVLTDSGGVQEEACILRVPCVTLRTTTERPETVEVGANVVAGYDPGRIVSLARRMMKKPRTWKNPFGDGRASQRILRALEKEAR